MYYQNDYNICDTLYRAEASGKSIIYIEYIVESITKRGIWITDGVKRSWRPFGSKFVSKTKDGALDVLGDKLLKENLRLVNKIKEVEAILEDMGISPIEQIDDKMEFDFE